MIKHTQLKRQLGLFGAIMMGLGSIIGTGVFVSIGIAAGIAGPSVIFAVVIGAIVALFNGLSSAQLAANHPVSGGTYEYGYCYLNSKLGFVAGWMFLLAKSASAATAALGFSGYVIGTLRLQQNLLIPLALSTILILTLIVLSGIKRSNSINIFIVSITIGSLLLFVITGINITVDNAKANLTPFLPHDLSSLFHASALMFVAYTGYGRIATLGEEVKKPHTTIPQAMIITLAITMLLYICVALVSVGAIGANGLNQAVQSTAAPLEVAATEFGIDGIPQIVTLGAITAMLGVLLNLILVSSPRFMYQWE
ncbi:MAG: hypothetical protein Kow00117_19160 [Phototrophicales bacterium]